MLIPQPAQRKGSRRHGGRRNSLAELRSVLARPWTLSDAHRQRLIEMARRAARVQALGDEYAGVSVSSHVQAALAAESDAA